jgi:hypothetical protein
MKISIHKTEDLSISEETIRYKLEIDGRIIEQVIEFNYLVVNMTSSGNLVKEIKTKTQKAARVAACLNDLVWRNKL